MAFAYISGVTGGGHGSGTALTVPAGCQSVCYIHALHWGTGPTAITINGVAMSEARSYWYSGMHGLGVYCFYQNFPTSGTLTLNTGGDDAIWAVAYFDTMISYVAGGESVTGAGHPHYFTLDATPLLSMFMVGASTGDDSAGLPFAYGTLGTVTLISQNDNPTSGSDQSRWLGYGIAPAGVTNGTIGWDSDNSSDNQVLVYSKFDFLPASGGPVWWT
jgi:hypothetical protein